MHREISLLLPKQEKGGFEKFLGLAGSLGREGFLEGVFQTGFEGRGVPFDALITWHGGGHVVAAGFEGVEVEFAFGVGDLGVDHTVDGHAHALHRLVGFGIGKYQGNQGQIGIGCFGVAVARAVVHLAGFEVERQEFWILQGEEGLHGRVEFLA